MRSSGEDAPQEMIRHMKIIFEANKMRTLFGDEVSEGLCTIDATKNPKTIDVRRTLPQPYAKGQKPPAPRSELLQGLYALDGKKLKVCIAESGQPRPKELSANAQDGRVLFVLERDNSSIAETRSRDLGVLQDIRRLGAEAFFAGREFGSQQLYVTLGQSKGDKELERLAPLIKKLSRITGLHLHDTQLTDSGLAHLKGLDNILIMNLSKTKITDAGLANLNGMVHLHHLILTGTQVTDEGIRTLKVALPKLTVEKLTAAQERAEDEVIKAGGILQSSDGGLSAVRFEGRKLTDADLGNLRVHLEVWKTTLKDLDLGNSKISDAGLEHLKGLTGLKRLTLTGTGATEAGTKSLEISLPGLQVKR